MLATRVIPTLLCRGRTLVKGKQFNGWRSVGNVLQAARIHGMRGVDEIVLLDIGATPEGRGPDLALVEELAVNFSTPLAVGGGVRTVDDVKNLLRAGADKVVVKSGGYSLIRDASRVVGSQAIVAALDYLQGNTYSEIAVYARMLEIAGAGEILLTAMHREGMMEGYDLDAIRAVSDGVSIPVISHGGCGSYQHMLEAIQAGAHAVAAGSLFQFTDCTPAGAAAYLKAHGVEVREAA